MQKDAEKTRQKTARLARSFYQLTPRHTEYFNTRFIHILNNQNSLLQIKPKKNMLNNKHTNTYWLQKNKS